MPRGARLDVPGVLQHVMVRGIERRDVFLDDEDRENFVRRLSGLLTRTGTECLAWALLPNHFHLLLRPHDTSLSTFMRRLLTGYAVTFNLRYQRAGHLFQNRYRSIVCDEETYLLEIVRYIHLNPLRAGSVSTLIELDGYPWSGHSVLMGRRSMEGQSVDEVLGRFGTTEREARRGYWHFVAAGVSLGHRWELAGGGLERSLVKAGRGPLPEAYDERVLGLGEFVEKLRQREELQGRLPLRLSLDELLRRVSKALGLETSRVLRRSTLETVADARGLFGYLAVARLGYRGTEVGAVLGLSRSGTSKAVERGRQKALAEPARVEAILASGPAE
ncbi:MAG: transposase [Deltaproteobacteria bacterium]|nr:transposase [Deltaproteobacteria bacterium]